MSRIGKKPIFIPEDVTVRIDGQKVTVSGPRGELSLQIRPEIKVKKQEEKILVSPQKDTKDTNALWGLSRSLIFNMVKGVRTGYEKKLQIRGLGYKAALEGNDIVLNIGFSHPVKIKIPSNIKCSIEKDIITVSGIDKWLVGQVAAKIKSVRPPEPYKGKGIRYLGEKVKRKEGKKAVATEF